MIWISVYAFFLVNGVFAVTFGINLIHGDFPIMGNFLVVMGLVNIIIYAQSLKESVREYVE